MHTSVFGSICQKDRKVRSREGSRARNAAQESDQKLTLGSEPPNRHTDPECDRHPAIFADERNSDASRTERVLLAVEGDAARSDLTELVLELIRRFDRRRGKAGKSLLLEIVRPLLQATIHEQELSECKSMSRPAETTPQARQLPHATSTVDVDDLHVAVRPDSKVRTTTRHFTDLARHRLEFGRAQATPEQLVREPIERWSGPQAAMRLQNDIAGSSQRVHEVIGSGKTHPQFSRYLFDRKPGLTLDDEL
jgi:hypothetical protein